MACGSAGSAAIRQLSASLCCWVNEPYTVLGVIGKDFVSNLDADVWLPFQFEPVSKNMNQFFQAAAKLKPGVTLAQANAQMKLAAAEYYRAYPAPSARTRSGSPCCRCATRSWATRAVR